MSGDGSAAQSQPATFNATFKHQIALHGHKGYYEVVSMAVSGDLNRRDQSARPRKRWGIRSARQRLASDDGLGSGFSLIVSSQSSR